MLTLNSRIKDWNKKASSERDEHVYQCGEQDLMFSFFSFFSHSVNYLDVFILILICFGRISFNSCSSCLPHSLVNFSPLYHLNWIDDGNTGDLLKSLVYYNLLFFFSGSDLHNGIIGFSEESQSRLELGEGTEMSSLHLTVTRQPNRFVYICVEGITSCVST